MRLSVDILAGAVQGYNLTKSGNTPLFSYTNASLFNNGSGANVNLLYLRGDSTAGRNSLSQFDNIVVYDAIIPEPSTVALVVAGSLGLFGATLIRRLRRR
jgi:hypothetical protein